MQTSANVLEATVNACSSCQREITGVYEYELKIKGGPQGTYCEECALEIKAAYESVTANPKLIQAAVAGFGTALVCAVLRSAFALKTGYEYGAVSLVIGWLVAQSVMHAAGNKRGLPVQLISAGMVMFGMIASEYLLLRFYLSAALAENGYAELPYLLPPLATLDLFVLAIREDMLTLVFWAIALLEGFYVPAPRKIRLQKRLIGQ